MSIIIRNPTMADAEALRQFGNEIVCEPGVFVMVQPQETINDVAEQEARMRTLLGADNIVYRLAEDDGKIVGEINAKGYSRMALRHVATLGMSVHKDYRGKGLGRAMLLEVIDAARSGGIIKRIELGVYERNTPARRLYESMGFEYEGCRKNFLFQDGEYHNDMMMALLF